MCGIVGTTNPGECAPEVFDRMVDCLSHRGPDGRGVFRDEFVALGHRRLAVLDLSSRGNQPMESDDGGVVLIFNGECYNHLELRKQLAGVEWKSSSDTETLLRLYERNGISFIKQVVGMFAICIYDKRAGKIYLIRDRLGEKPLYYFQRGSTLAFASELRALIAHPELPRELDQEALQEYFLFNYIPQPRTIIKGVRKLAPGRVLCWDVRTWESQISSYWDPRPLVARCRRGQAPRQHWEEFEHLLREAVRLQTIADVPLGCFLSGGIDSSAIACLLAEEAPSRLKTFTIGFRESGYDEAPFAREIARRLGSEHHEHQFGEEDALALVPSLGATLSEPFADASLLPMLLLARFTRHHVTVALSGDGGDELLLGYDRYRWAAQVRHWTARVPDRWRVAGARTLEAMPSYKAKMLGRGLAFPSSDQLYPYVFTGWNVPFVERLLGRPMGQRIGDLSITRYGRQVVTSHENRWCRSMEERAAWTDLRHYLPDDVLHKVDRAAMAASLETRAPLLDHRVVEFALHISHSSKVYQGMRKYPLRHLLQKRLPRALFDRRKAGFAVPLRHWFRGRLRPFLDEVLAPEEIRTHGLFNYRYVREMLRDHQLGRMNYERQLFAMLVFQLWYREYMR